MRRTSSLNPYSSVRFQDKVISSELCEDDSSSLGGDASDIDPGETELYLINSTRELMMSRRQSVAVTHKDS